VLNEDQSGRLVTENFSFARSGSDATGLKVYCPPTLMLVAGAPEMAGGRFAACASAAIKCEETISIDAAMNEVCAFRCERRQHCIVKTPMRLDRRCDPFQPGGKDRRKKTAIENFSAVVSATEIPRVSFGSCSKSASLMSNYSRSRVSRRRQKTLARRSMATSRVNRLRLPELAADT
jgi:hypothetical protein